MSTDITLIAFVFLATLSSGLLGAAALAVCRGEEPRSALLEVGAGSVLLAAAGGVSLLSLGHPEMFLGALSHVGTGIFWELLGSLVALAAAVIFLILCLRDEEGTLVSILISLSALGALMVVFGVGRSFLMPWRAAWNSPSIPGVFLGFALACAANFYLFKASREKNEEPLATWIKVLAAALAPLFMALYFVHLNGTTSPEGESLLLAAVSGSSGILTWVMVVLGVLVPSFLILSKIKQSGLYLLGALFAAAGAGIYQFILFTLDTPAWQFFVR